MKDPALPVEERFGAYRLLEPLGQGGMAVVARAERLGDAGFRKRVALKRILPQYRRDPSLLERFAAEARTGARLDHPNLVQLLDFGLDPEPYLVLEFVEGVSLGALLARLSERRETLDVAAACFIGAEVALGLDHAHRKKDDDGTPLGIVHRDVSPQNVLLGHEGAVKVSDFGLVKAADNVLKTQSGVTIGKLNYMAPEQSAGGDVDARADVFSLGVVLWEMLTIRPLLPLGDPAALLRALHAGAFPPPSSVHADVPPELDELVLACLAVDREARTPSAQQVSQDLRAIQHARAPGYGREQLARTLQWLFPERGWELPEPERPALQPSLEERASLSPNTPAPLAFQRARRAARVGGADGSGRSDPGTSGGLVRKRGTWLALGAGLGAAVVLGLLAAAALAVTVWQRSRGSAGFGVGPDVGHSVVVSCDAPGARFALGDRPLPGRSPQILTRADLGGAPLVVMAPGREAVIVRPERLFELAMGRGDGAVFIPLPQATLSEQLVHVHFQGEGTAQLEEGEELGPVPGVVRVQWTQGERPPMQLRIFDHQTGAPQTYSLSGCDPARVCSIDVGRSSVP